MRVVKLHKRKQQPKNGKRRSSERAKDARNGETPPPQTLKRGGGDRDERTKLQNRRRLQKRDLRRSARARFPRLLGDRVSEAPRCGDSTG